VTVTFRPTISGKAQSLPERRQACLLRAGSKQVTETMAQIDQRLSVNGSDEANSKGKTSKK